MIVHPSRRGGRLESRDARRAGWACALALVALVGCAPMPAGLSFERDATWPAAELLLLGEQHDARQHQRLAARVTAHLAGQGRLAAVALEMAERGRSTAGLPAAASEAQARAALAWDERGWPWSAYGPIVMSAVRAGVPVVGANLPRAAPRCARQPAMRRSTPLSSRRCTSGSSPTCARATAACCPSRSGRA